MGARLRITRREILIEEFLKPRRICITKFAVDTGLTFKDIDDINPETAKILADYTGQSIGFWENISLNTKSYDRALVQLNEIFHSPLGEKDFGRARRLIDQIERFEKSQYEGE